MKKYAWKELDNLVMIYFLVMLWLCIRYDISAIHLSFSVENWSLYNNSFSGKLRYSDETLAWWRKTGWRDDFRSCGPALLAADAGSEAVAMATSSEPEVNSPSQEALKCPGFRWVRACGPASLQAQWWGDLLKLKLCQPSLRVPLYGLFHLYPNLRSIYLLLPSTFKMSK